MKIGIYTRSLPEPDHERYVREFFTFLSKQDDTIIIHKNAQEVLRRINFEHNFQVFSETNDQLPFDILLSLGGDGTVLDTLRIVRGSGIPVLGVNLGRFGFLASSRLEAFEENYNNLKTGKYDIEHRSVIQLESDLNLFDGFPYALNDFIVHKKDSSSMITVHARLNHEPLTSYWADGVILATPTGSTGYSLSCGGPIVYPGSSSFVLTPIAPHNLTIRPIVLNDQSTLSFEIEGRTEDFLVTMDSRSETVPKGTKLRIARAPFDLHMISLEGQTYTQTIRNKLLWGVDRRN